MNTLLETSTTSSEVVPGQDITLTWLGRTATGSITHTPAMLHNSNAHQPPHIDAYYFKPGGDAKPNPTWIVPAALVDAVLAAS